MPRLHSSETRAESVAQALLEIRGWRLQKPPRGNVLWKNEYRSYPNILEAFEGKGKKGKGGDAYPDFLLVDAHARPLLVGETKASSGQITKAISDSEIYGDALIQKGMTVLAAGIAGDDKSNISVVIKKRGRSDWMPISYMDEPIQWIPTYEETSRLLQDVDLYDLRPKVPSAEILAKRGEEINRILRECGIKDELRPAVIGAFMLSHWKTRGRIRTDPDYVLTDINEACKSAFKDAGKPSVAESILVQAANRSLAAKAQRICYILRLLNVTNLTSEHDYIGQLYETFFRFTGGNTIGQYFTPRHITKFLTEMCQVSERDRVVDPTCGTGGFLIAALYRMMGNRPFNHDQIDVLVRDHLIGFEQEPITAALCIANMILRGDGTTGIIDEDCFTSASYPIESATVVMGNPPFPHKSTDTPPELFINRGLEALSHRGTLEMIVPMSLLVKSEKKNWRAEVLKNNSLRAVITLPSELFQPYASSTTAIVALEKGIPHNAKTKTFFCQITHDGFRLKKNIRVESSENQLPEALSAYLDYKNVPGFATMAAVPNFNQGIEWSPGAYIIDEHSDEQILNEVDYLIRSLASFHAKEADGLVKFQRDLKSEILKSKPYNEITNRKPPQISESDLIGNLFDIYYGQKSLHSKERLRPGNSLIISSAGSDNGCYGFFEFADLINPPFVTVPSTGSIGEALIQVWPCGVTDDCLLLMPKPGTDEADMYIAAAIIRLERWRFNYGRKITPKKLATMNIAHKSEVKFIVQQKLNQVRPLFRHTIRVLSYNYAISEEDHNKFQKLVTEWQVGRGHYSKIKDLVMHPAYQQIIGMGECAIPFLLKELEAKPGHWSWALNAITGETPVPASSRGKLKEEAKAWLEWGREKGYQW